MDIPQSMISKNVEQDAQVKKLCINTYAIHEPLCIVIFFLMISEPYT